MTAVRRYGDDTPFGTWLRAQRSLDSHQHAFTANDADWIVLKYRTWLDGVGTREVQLQMLLEVKTNGAEPNGSQQEALFFQDQLLRKKRKVRRLSGDRVMLWSFGVFVLSLSGARPADGEVARWGMFDMAGNILWSHTKREQAIVELLGFERNPRKPRERLSLRRHHKNDEVLMREQTPLGFVVETKKTFRS